MLALLAGLKLFPKLCDNRDELDGDLMSLNGVLSLYFLGVREIVAVYEPSLFKLRPFLPTMNEVARARFTSLN
jgi:hypothetical protein